MYILDLNMSNIKSEALAQGCPKRKVFLKNSPELTGRQLRVGVSIIIKVRAARIK